MLSAVLYSYILQYRHLVGFVRCVCVCTCVYSVVSDSATAWTVAHQAPLSMEISRQEYWSGLPFPNYNLEPSLYEKIIELLS